MSKSLQDIIKRRQQEEFVGRREQLAFFRRNLRYDPYNDRRRFIINVFGQGGVGKTWLLRCFRKLAEEAGYVSACTDESESDILEVMSRIAEQFEVQGHPLRLFAKRYRIYREQRKEIEADPERPQGFSALLGRTLARGGLGLARQVPVGGVIAGFVDEEVFTNLAEELVKYIAQKIGNKDEVQLMLEPVEILSPLFLTGLRKTAEKHHIALFFDTYEYTGNLLDSWLRRLLEGCYGDLPVDIVLGIIGRDELDRNNWVPYEGLLARLPLEPFTEEEAHDYLGRKSITDKRVAKVILHLSGRLPLLMATLTVEIPDDPAQVGDPSGEALERFFGWVKDPKRRQVTLDAALPRRLNRDVLAVLVEEEDAGTLFSWLKGMPFVEKRGNGWVYHNVVRAQVLRHKRHESPKRWVNLHRHLAEYYENLRDSLGLDKETGRKNETWQGHALEALYHRLCQTPQTQLPEALGGFLSALETRRTFAYHLASVINDAGEDSGSPFVQEWGQRLAKGLEYYEKTRYQEALKAFTTLPEEAGLGERWRAVAFAIRGEIYRRMSCHEEALADFSRALELDPDLSRATAGRGVIYYQMKCYEEALVDFDRTLETSPDMVWAIVSRAKVYMKMDRHKEALVDFDRAVKLSPDQAWVIANRGLAYQIGIERYDKALTDFSRSIELDPDLVWAIAARGIVHTLKRHFKEALTDLNRAIELDSDYALTIAARGDVYRHIRRYEEALADFDQALKLEPDQAWVIARRGQVYKVLDSNKEALTDLNQALKLKPDLAWAIACRGEVYMKMGHYEEALADCDRSITQKPNAWAIGIRGILHALAGRNQDALADFNWSIELPPDLDPDLAWVVAHRGETYCRMGCYEEALTDFDRAIELDSDLTWAITGRGATYLLMGYYDNALADFDQAIKQEPRNDRYLYGRGLTYWIIGRTSQFRSDIITAIQIVQQKCKNDHKNWDNLLNLALYYLLIGEAKEAEHLYQEACSASPHHTLLKAIYELDNFLALFPDHSHARVMRDLLQEYIQTG